MKLFEIKKGSVARGDTRIDIFPESGYNNLTVLSESQSDDKLPIESYLSISRNWYGTTINQYYEYKVNKLIISCIKSNRLTNWLTYKLIDYIDYCKPEQPVDNFIFQAFNLKIGDKKNWMLTLEFSLDLLKSYKLIHLANPKNNTLNSFYYHLRLESKGTDSDFLSSGDVMTVVKKVQSMHSIFLKEVKASSFEDLKKIESLESNSFKTYTTTDSMYFSTKRMDISCFFT